MYFFSVTISQQQNYLFNPAELSGDKAEQDYINFQLDGMRELVQKKRKLRKAAVEHKFSKAVAEIGLKKLAEELAEINIKKDQNMPDNSYGV